MGKLASCRAQYYCERTLQEHAMLAFQPSQVGGLRMCMYIIHTYDGLG